MSRTGSSTESTNRSNDLNDPRVPDYPKPPFRSQRQPMPGLTSVMSPVPDHGEKSYKGAGRLEGRQSGRPGGGWRYGRAVGVAEGRGGPEGPHPFLEGKKDAKE